MSRQTENSEEVSLLNPVNITSNVRAPGEYKYYYCGENATEKDKSFLAVSTMWYTTKISSEHELLASTYNNDYTAQLYLNKTQKIYSLFVYKNIIDYRNENFDLKNVQVINIPIPIFLKNGNIEFEKILSKIYFAANNYILLNDIDNRILLIDFSTGKYVTIFERTDRQGEKIYNVIDTFDEGYFSLNQPYVRTYVFIAIKHIGKKDVTYSYYYFIIQRGNLETKNFYLHSLDLSLDDSEPCGIKITKITKPDRKEQKWFFIFCFFTYQTLFQLVTNWESTTLHHILKQFSHIQGNSQQMWSNKIMVEEGKKEYGQATKIFLNINTSKLCSLILFFEKGFVMSLPFYYSDTPEEIKNKIFIKDKIKIDKSQKSDLKKNLEIYQINDNYIFKQKTICAYHGQSLVMASKEMLYIFKRYERFPYYKYNFYEESLSMFMNFEGLGSVFLLTKDKAFKIIYNPRFETFSNSEILKASNYCATDMNYPIFEYVPEEIYTNYQKQIFGKELDPPDNKLNFTKKDTFSKNNSIVKPTTKNEETKETCCEICGRPTKLKCKECGMRYYCSADHYKYDYFTYHFFECQMIQFFKRTDIMSIPNKEQRYITLYNELIKTFNKILNYIFSRIFCSKDYHFFLQFIITIIDIMNNFGFIVNLEEFSSSNLVIQPEQKTEKVLFYMECIFYYYQMNILKCTFTMKGRLYNLTDCYIKILKNELAPKLTRKIKTRIVTLKCDKFKKELFYKNKYFDFLKSDLFFDIYSYFKGDIEIVDLVELYIIRHLFSLSLLVKFKIKIGSAIEVKETFVDISLMFEDHYKDLRNTRNTILYCYFSICYYLVEIGKVPQTIKLLKRMVTSFSEKTNNELKALSFYNLGLLQYAVGDFRIGIHNLETSYKLIVENNLSAKFLLSVLDSLALAYLNQRSLFKAYILIRMSIRERKKIKMKENELKCIKLNVYLNYIIDLYEYSFITRARMQIKKRNTNYDEHQLIKYVLGEEDKESITSEQNLEQFIHVVQFIFKLSDSNLADLHQDNPSRTTILTKEDVHHERSLSFNMESSSTSSFLAREQQIEKEENIEEYDEDIEVKHKLYDSLTRQQQSEFKELKRVFLKRDIVLRDSLGAIEAFNINYHPIYSEEFKKIIDKLKSNFLLKEIFYCFQTEKWRDELYNYNANSCLFGLAKYLKLEKIKNMLAIEKSKLFDSMKKEKQEIKEARNSVLKRRVPSQNISSSEFDGLVRSSKTNHTLIPPCGINEISYQDFKQKFIDELKAKEKENKELYSYLNLSEDYLLSLYNNVFKNNPDHDFIFQNPVLILNYIFTELTKGDTEQNNEMLLPQDTSTINKTNTMKSMKSMKSNQSLPKLSISSPVRGKKLSKKVSVFKMQLDNEIKENEEKNEESKSNLTISENSEQSQVVEDENTETIETVRQYHYDTENIQECNQVEEYCYIYLPADDNKEKEENEEKSVLEENSNILDTKIDDVLSKKSIIKGRNKKSIFEPSFSSSSRIKSSWNKTLPYPTSRRENHKNNIDIFKSVQNKAKKGIIIETTETDRKNIKPKRKVHSQVKPKKEYTSYELEQYEEEPKSNKNHETFEKDIYNRYWHPNQRKGNEQIQRIIKSRNKSNIGNNRRYLNSYNEPIVEYKEMKKRNDLEITNTTVLTCDQSQHNSRSHLSENSNSELGRILQYNKNLRLKKLKKEY